jgi:hypothetical protein
MKNKITSQLLAIKNEVRNLDVKGGTFESGRSIFMFDLTVTGKVKANSVKFFSTIENYNNCSY